MHQHTLEQNGHVKSFHKGLKKEYIWLHDFKTFQDVEAAISYVFEDYNQHMVHSVIGYIIQSEFDAVRMIMMK